MLHTIGIDCRLAGGKHGGIGRYIQNLVIELLALYPKMRWTLFFFDVAQAEEVLSSIKQEGRSNIKIVFVPVQHYTFAEQFKLPKVFAAEKLDLLHVPHFNIPLFYNGKIVVTIHDLLWHEFKGPAVTTLPMWKYALKYLFYIYVVGEATRKAARIFVPAETIKKTVEKYYPRTKQKIVVTKEGVPTEWTKLLQKSTRTPEKKKQFVYVGSLYPHKNVRLVIDALPELPEFSLVLVGTRNVFQKEIEEYVAKKNLSQRVEFKGYLTDRELVTLLEKSFALVQPSFSEGFGLTGMEAMTINVPVLASQIPIFQEIYRDAAIFFDPKRVDSFVKAVQKLETMDREKLSKKGQKVVGQYSWNRMAKDTAEHYWMVLS